MWTPLANGIADPVGVVLDREGRQYHRSAAGDYSTKLVFDLPADVASPKLHVHEGTWIARLSEMFLIGDEDSLFHKKTLFGWARTISFLAFSLRLPD